MSHEMNTSMPTLGELPLPELLAIEWPVASMVLFCGIASAVMYIYDCTITLSTEVENIWSRKINFPSLLYLLNRYGVLLYEVFFLASVIPGIPSMACQNMRYVGLVFQVLIIIGAPAIFSLRTFVICGRSWIVLSILIAINVARMGVVLDIVVEQWALPLLPTELQIGPYVCFPAPPRSLPKVGKLILVEVALFIAFDSVVFILTCIRLLRLYIEKKKLEMVGNKITFIFLRDGAIYYFLALILGIVNIGLVVYSSEPFGLAVLETLTSISGSINQVLISILANRLMLNLRESRSEKSDHLVSDMINRNNFVMSTVPLGSMTFCPVPAPSITGQSEIDEVEGYSSGNVSVSEGSLV